MTIVLRAYPAVLALVLFAAGLASSQTATVIFVDSTAGAAGDGSSWASAYDDLPSALQEAETLPPGTIEIWVAAGSYPPSASGDRNASVGLLSYVGIYGGFTGSETARNQRNPAAAVTVLTGDLLGNDPITTDNSYHVVTVPAGADASAVLDGFTITAGHAAGAGFPALEGGGLLVVGGSATIVNCTITGNSATAGGGVGVDSGSPSLIGCTIELNTSMDIGGGLYNKIGTPTLTACTFRQNSSGHQAGGLADMQPFSSTTITDCIFDGNAATGGDGGGLFVHPQLGASTPVLTNCLFLDNTASGSGGAVYAGRDVNLTNCTFNGNTAGGSGGGAYAGFGGGSLGNLTIDNCILWGNIDGGGTGETAQIDEGFINQIEVNHSCVEGWTGAMGGAGNTGSDPLFVDAPANDFHLAAGSPCIDAGDNFAFTVGVTLDFEGDARFMNDLATPDTGQGTAPIIDMGIDEYPGTTASGTFFIRGDCDGDGDIDLADSSYNMQYLFAGGPSLCLEAHDLDDQGSINIADVVRSVYWVFGVGSPPASPFPGCGHDTTNDPNGCDTYICPP